VLLKLKKIPTIPSRIHKRFDRHKRRWLMWWGMQRYARQMRADGSHAPVVVIGAAKTKHGTKSVSVERYEEARDTGADVLAVGCPFCMQMFESSKGMVANAPVVKDIVELIADNLSNN
jgi:hypothetical protein